MKFITIQNNTTVALEEIPVNEYPDFYEGAIKLLKNPLCHCVNYYGFRKDASTLKMIFCVADDSNSQILVNSYELKTDNPPVLDTLTRHFYGLHCFEREISENFGIKFKGHPWDKPIRYPADRFDTTKTMDNYPFYTMDSHELHEVGVGPIHAGIIEPGHFRFVCNGEIVLHLEIQLGYQHRGVEELMLTKKNLTERTILVESLAGDTVAGNMTAFANNFESLAGIGKTRNISIERCLALELERVAVHTGDLSALCVDVAYQLGSAVLQGLRTLIINSFLAWSGNRFAHKLLRVGYSPAPLTAELRDKVLSTLDFFDERFNEVCHDIFNQTSVLSRFERTGAVTKEQAELIQSVGMAARSSGLERDIRSSHPHDFYTEVPYKTKIYETGDVYARALLRREEVVQSLKYIRTLFDRYNFIEKPDREKRPVVQLKPSSFCLSLTEGWRGEICHCAITGNQGELKHYKFKDPSLHNWFALALAVRNNDISDFPVCNKSFNLSYCGHDL